LIKKIYNNDTERMKRSFAKVFENLVRYRTENNFIELSK